MTEVIKKTVDDWLNEVKYDMADATYIPSDFALNYVNFIKLVNGAEGESNTTPVVHFKMLDLLAGPNKRLANLCSRGFGKTVLFGEYLVLYIAVYGEIPGFGDITGMIYVSDSMDNGVKSLRKNIEHRYYSSDFLQTYLPSAKFTDAYMEFTNASGHKLGVKSFGSQSGLRGTKIFGKRPVLAVLDDLVSDSDAKSKTVMEAIKDTVYKGVDHALDPTRKKVVFCGTPFAKSDILYEAVESGGWHVNVFPICEKFPCSKEEFRGAWEERFDYEFVKEQYELAVATGQLAAFQQELMLRITSLEDRLILDSDIVWYRRSSVLANKGSFNFYITTDFATSEKTSADYSVLSVWAYSSNGDWLWVDGTCKRQTMDKNIEDLFKFVQMYRPQSVGIEVTGQQGGFIPWIQDQMISRNCYFNLASENNSSKAGIRPSTNKLQRFNVVVPWFKTKKVWLPEDCKDHPWVQEAIEELTLVTKDGFKSKHDDIADTISMLSVMQAWKPSTETPTIKEDGSIMWEDDPEDEVDSMDSYVV